MSLQKKYLLLSLCIIVLVIYKISGYSWIFTESIQEEDTNPMTKFKKFGLDKMNSKKEYYAHCQSLYKKLRFPDPKLIIKPPIQEIPPEMLVDFTDHGDLPLKKYYYFNEAYSDSNSDDKTKLSVVSNAVMDNFLTKVKNNEPLGYGDKNLNKVMHKYEDQIKGKSIAVIGTVSPWVEAIALDVGASLITTLEYTRKRYENPKLEWIHVNDYLDDAIANSKFEQFDSAASFSSIEHSGLGRFGDPLAPYGDFEAIQQIHCMLKPNALLFLALPYSKSNDSYLEFNAHRIYGDFRLKKLFEGWNLEMKDMDSNDLQGIFVLRKKQFNF